MISTTANEHGLSDNKCLWIDISITVISNNINIFEEQTEMA